MSQFVTFILLLCHISSHSIFIGCVNNSDLNLYSCHVYPLVKYFSQLARQELCHQLCNSHLPSLFLVLSFPHFYFKLRVACCLLLMSSLCIWNSRTLWVLKTSLCMWETRLPREIKSMGMSQEYSESKQTKRRKVEGKKARKKQKLIKKWEKKARAKSWAQTLVLYQVTQVLGFSDMKKS